MRFNLSLGDYSESTGSQCASLRLVITHRVPNVAAYTVEGPHIKEQDAGNNSVEDRHYFIL